MCISHHSVARFDFSWLDAKYHQETVDNLRKATKNVKRLCAVSQREADFSSLI